MINSLAVRIWSKETEKFQYITLKKSIGYSGDLASASFHSVAE
jgi:hypothetical protein